MPGRQARYVKICAQNSRDCPRTFFAETPLHTHYRYDGSNAASYIGMYDMYTYLGKILCTVSLMSIHGTRTVAIGTASLG